jgi:hypothetical protein
MGSVDRVYQMGGTFAVIGLSGAQQVLPAAGQIGWRVAVTAGGSSGVAFMQAAGQVTCSQGLLLGTTNVHIDGPATFFLAAQGSTAIVGLAPLYSGGFSLLGKF